MCSDSAKHLPHKNFRVGDWLASPSEGTISRRGDIRHLEPKIMDVLAFFADHPAEVVSKDEMFQAVWRDTFVTEVALTRCISELRTALGDDAKDPQFIETIPKRGYRLIAPVRTAAPRHRALVPTAVAALVIASVGLAVYLLEPKAQDDLEDPSIAVLPFEDLSRQTSNAYFADGITEDVIAHLSKIQGIRVISRTTVMRYRDAERNLPEIARELGVAMILEGSVRLESNRVRISSQLIDARTDVHIWAETYDRSLDDIFEIQTDVAERIAAAMEVTVSTAEQQLLSRRPTEDFGAYDAYMKARNYYRRYRYDDNENAIELFKKSIALDPDFALAYAGLADAYSQRVHTWRVDGEWTDAAMEAAQKAISIDPELPEGYKALGFCYSNRDWLTQSLEAYQKALDLRPQYEAAMANTAVVLNTLGRWDEALIWARRRLEYAPSHVIACTNIGEILINLGFRDEATLWLDEALAGEPYYFDAHKQLAYGELFGGQAEAARQRMTQLLKVHPNNVGSLIIAGETELLSGHPDQAKTYFERAVEASQGSSIYAHLRLGELLSRKDEQQAERHLGFVSDACLAKVEEGAERWFNPWALAVTAAAHGKDEEALDWLQKAVDQGRLYRGWDLNEPAFENLREQPEFLELMERMRAKVEEMHRRVSAAAQRGEILLVPDEVLVNPSRDHP